ncbi:protein FREE1-like [Musa acuminata AAA Group]|uniref:protein FREE1-like n=1 Tax=Musa acuminata AAA Group TaxID=214697 RepID=UPI0031E19E7F
MQHGSDYSSYYAPQSPPPPTNPSSVPAELPPSTPIQQLYASAPPYSTDFPLAAAPGPGPSSYAPFSQNPEPASCLPPSVPSYGQPQSQLPPQFPSFPPYNSSSYPPETSPSPTASLYPHQQPSSVPYYPYDPNQLATGSHASPMNPISVPTSSPNPSSSLSSPYTSYNVSQQSSAMMPEQEAQYFNDNSGRYGASLNDGYGHSRSGFGQEFHEKNLYAGMHYDEFGPQDDGLGDGVYQYDGGRSEPYGSRGTVPTRSPTLFDDYGRSVSFPSVGNNQGGSVGKIVRAVPKEDMQPDVNNGQKFRVKLLLEGGGQNTTDVLCQIGLDGIRMLDPSTNRTLRIYPLETVTRWEVLDSSTFAFWSKSFVDIDPRRIRLQSNSYTTNTILDTVTAATVQLKEMGGNGSLTRGEEAADASKVSDQSAERKKSLVNWMNLIKPANEEKDHWVPDEAVSKCTSCGSDFGAFNRRHHCRNCGDIFCDKCTKGRIALTTEENAQQVQVCDRCMAEVSQRLSNAKEAVSKPAGLQSHEDLARRLQEELNKNRKSGSNSDESWKPMREVACPICTVHLQVQVPASGSQTIECGVCQHPFLVSAD